jgi:hypothetical protein
VSTSYDARSGAAATPDDHCLSLSVAVYRRRSRCVSLPVSLPVSRSAAACATVCRCLSLPVSLPVAACIAAGCRGLPLPDAGAAPRRGVRRTAALSFWARAAWSSSCAARSERPAARNSSRSVRSAATFDAAYL